MARMKPRGSILLEIIIVLLVLALIATIMYPKKIWEDTEKETEICHSNMDKILKAELIYLKYHNNYEDTLDKVISFLQNDSTGELGLEYIYSDTALADNILKSIKSADAEANSKVEVFLADTLVKTIIFTTKYDSSLATAILKRLQNTSLSDSILAAKNEMFNDIDVLEKISNIFAPLDIISPLRDDDSLKLVLERIKPEISIGALVDTLYRTEKWAAQINSAIKNNFEMINICPTNLKSYDVTVIDTSVIKILKINCPLDSTEIKNSKKDFLKYHLGHLRLQNHGNIDGGEKSWLK